MAARQVALSVPWEGEGRPFVGGGNVEGPGCGVEGGRDLLGCGRWLGGEES